MFNFFFRFPGGRPDVTFTLNEDQVSGANDIPKQHKFILTGVVGQSLSILTETPAAGEGKIGTGYSGINLYMRPAIERWRYNIVTSSLIGCVHTQNDPWILQFLCLCFFNLLYFSCLFFYMYISVSSLVTWTMEWPVQISSIPWLLMPWLLWSGRLQIDLFLPSDTIWQQRSWSTLAQVMAWCLMTPSHYLNKCWLTISKVQCDSHLSAISQEIPHPSIAKISLNITSSKISLKAP